MIDELTNFEKIYEISDGAYDGIEEQNGFEIFQTFRNAFLNLMSNSEFIDRNIEEYLAIESFDKFKLIDKAYIDNLFLCMSLKNKDEKLYQVSLETIDKYIRPKRTDNLNQVRKTAVGYLSYLLVEVQKISQRQTFYLVSNIFGIGESVIEEEFRNIQDIKKEVSIDLEPVLIVYYFLFNIKFDLKKIKAIKENHKRSETELQKAVLGFEKLNKVIFMEYLDNAIILEKYSNSTILDFITDLDLNFLKNNNYPKSPTYEEVFYLLAVSVGNKYMPSYMKNPKEKFI